MTDQTRIISGAGMAYILRPNHPAERKAYIITGPTSGFGLATSFEVANTARLPGWARPQET